jgi:Palmitoyl protein thioesterase
MIQSSPVRSGFPFRSWFPPDPDREKKHCSNVGNTRLVVTMMKKARNNSNVLLLFLNLLLFIARPCWSRLGDVSCASPAEWEAHPRLCKLAEAIRRQDQSPHALAQELFDFAAENGWIVDFRDDASSSSFPKPEEDESAMVQSSSRRKASSLGAVTRTRTTSSTVSSSSSVPIVLAHGMGDSCYNGGMQHVTQLMTDWLGVYAVCIPTGGSPSDDTNDGFFLVRSNHLDCLFVFRDNDSSRVSLSLSLSREIDRT